LHNRYAFYYVIKKTPFSSKCQSMIEVLILSIIQGITEFLPVSSSSHLLLISEFGNLKNHNLSIDVSLHIGSFFAVLTYFYKDIINFVKNKELFFKIFISSLPLMIIGFVLTQTNLINEIRNIKVISWTTIIFGIFLYLGDKCKLDKNIKNDFNLKTALIIGFFQILSLIPGVSRSGIGITAARFLNYRREDAAKISFLLSIPILGAVSFYGIKNIILSDEISLSILNIASIVLSFLFSYFTIKYFLKFIRKFSLKVFVIYRVLLGMILLTLIYL